MKTTIKIFKRSIRKERNTNNYRVILGYITSKGLRKIVSFIVKDASRCKAQNMLDFRLQGVTKSAELVELEN